MDSQTANAIAELRGQLSALRAALGARDPDDAAMTVRRLKKGVEDLQAAVASLQAQVDALFLFTDRIPAPVALADAGSGSDSVSVAVS